MNIMRFLYTQKYIFRLLKRVKVLYKFRMALILLGLSFVGVEAQTIIQELKLEDYYDDNGIYPFDYHSGNIEMLYKAHDPILRLSENDFIHIWRNKEFDSRVRAVTRYNILLEEFWQSEIELRDDEEIAGIYRSDTTLYILTTEYESRQDEYRLMTRTLGLESGKQGNIQILSVIPLDQDDPLFLDFSPNDSLFAIYYYCNSHPRKRIRYYYDHPQGEDELGVRAERVEYAVIDVYDITSERIYKDTITISEDPNNKIDVINGALDNEGNFYLSTIQKDQTLTMYQYNRSSLCVNALSLPNFPRYWRETDLYNAHFPPLMGKDERIYLAYCDRDKKKRVGMQTGNIQVVTFDFKHGEIDMRRRINIDSSILVEVSKAREDAGLKPITKFDKYMIHSMIETPDQGLMLLMQKFNQENRLGIGASRSISMFSPIAQGTPTTILEEIVIFQFDPYGKYERVLVIPSYQRIKVAIEMMGYFFNVHPDWEDQSFHFLIHENGGKKFGDPLRLYYKTLDLVTGKISERKQIFEHKRRNHYFSRPHTVWLNDQVVATLMHVNTSLNTLSYWITYSID